MKTAQNYLEEANAVVPKLSTEEAIALHQEGGAVFVDVRDSGQIAASGTVAGLMPCAACTWVSARMRSR